MSAGTPWRSASALMVCRQAWKSPPWAFAGPRAGPARSTVIAVRRGILERGVMPPILSRAGDGQPLDSHGRRIGGALELQVVGRSHVEEHVLEIARHRDAAHRPAELAVLDPEARRAAAIVAGDAVDAKADQVGDEEPALDVADQLLDRELAFLEVEVQGGGRGRARRAARGVTGRLQLELTGGGQIKQPRREMAIVDHGVALGRQALGIE